MPLMTRGLTLTSIQQVPRERCQGEGGVATTWGGTISSGALLENHYTREVAYPERDPQEFEAIFDERLKVAERQERIKEN
jgi:hypothetical protein